MRGAPSAARKTLPQPRAKRREAPRERAVPALRTRPAVATTVHGVSQRISARKAMFRASTAHSGRNSSEFRRPVRGSERASQRIQKRFRKRLRIRLQSRERSAARASGPGAPHTARRGHNCPRHFATYVSAEDGAVRSNRSLWPSFSPNDGASFAALKARPNAFRNGFGTAFRAASGAARSAAGTRGPGAARTARRGHNCARRFATHVSAEDGAVRSNRSLWPSFWRTTAAVRGSERASSAFGNDFGERRPPRSRLRTRAAAIARRTNGAHHPG